jgi:hypothetical protein
MIPAAMMIVCMIHEKGARKQANSIGACGVAPHALRYAEGRGKRAGGSAKRL